MGGALYFLKPLNAKDGVRGAHRDVYSWRVSENSERNPEMSVLILEWIPGEYAEDDDIGGIRMPKLILLRHGESLWNKANRFTGWVDIPLSANGILEASAAGKAIANTPIDCIYTSTLIRAQMTATLVMQEHHSSLIPILMHDESQQMTEWSQIHSQEALKTCIPMHADWRLNERYYGLLQGADKQETREKYGEAQVKIWRRSYDVPPPEGESLQMTAERTLPCLDERIIPELNQGRTVLIVAHGNSLRSIVMRIEHLSKEDILEYEIATGQPIIYNYDGSRFKK